MLIVSTSFNSKIFFPILAAKSLCRAIIVSCHKYYKLLHSLFNPHCPLRNQMTPKETSKQGFQYVVSEKVAILVCNMTLQRKEGDLSGYWSSFVEIVSIAHGNIFASSWWEEVFVLSIRFVNTNEKFCLSLPELVSLSLPSLLVGWRAKHSRKLRQYY